MKNKGPIRQVLEKLYKRGFEFGEGRVDTGLNYDMTAIVDKVMLELDQILAAIVYRILLNEVTGPQRESVRRMLEELEGD